MHTINFHILNDANIHTHSQWDNTESVSQRDYSHDTLLIMLKVRWTHHVHSYNKIFTYWTTQTFIHTVEEIMLQVPIASIKHWKCQLLPHCIVATQIIQGTG